MPLKLCQFAQALGLGQAAMGGIEALRPRCHDLLGRRLIVGQHSAVVDLLLNKGAQGGASAHKEFYGTAILSGGNLSLKAGGELTNQASSIAAYGDIAIEVKGAVKNYLTADKYVQTEHERLTGTETGSSAGVTTTVAGTLTKTDTWKATWTSTQWLDQYKEDEQLALSPGYIASLSNSLDIEERAPWWLGGWCIKCIHTHEYTGVVQGGDISTLLGDIILSAKRDIRNVGSRLSAGAEIALNSQQDILLDAETVEVANQNKTAGFSGWFAYGSEKTRWNNFTTQLSQLEGGSITAAAKRNLTGIGATLLVQTDIALSADGSVTFDAEQNQKYLSQTGWSLGWGFKGSDILETLATKGGQEAFQKYVNSNPMLAAVSELTTKRKRGINEWINLGLTTSQTLSAAQQTMRKDGVIGALVKQFNPLPDVAGVAAGCTKNASLCLMQLGASFRYAAWTSEQTWTESHISYLLAGQDVTIGAGKDIALVGGTIASSARDLSVLAGRDVLVTALADTTTSKAANWGLNLDFSPAGITVGGNVFKSKSNSVLYTNAQITAGGDLTAVSGRDMRLAGVNAAGTNIRLDVGRDLVVASRQNVTDSSSFGFNFSVTFAPNGTPTAGSIGGSLGQANRLYTDTPTTIIAEKSLNAYVGNTTFLLGAMMNSKSGQLTLDTDTFVFDHYGDKDFERNVSAQLKLSTTSNPDANGSYFYRNKEGLTFATVGAGEIKVRKPRDGAPGTSLIALNRDAANVQRLVKDETINIKIPTINLAQVIQDLKNSADYLRAVIALGGPTPEYVLKLGPRAEGYYRKGVAYGMSAEEFRDFVNSGAMRSLLQAEDAYSAAMAKGNTRLAAALLKMIADGQQVYIHGEDGKTYAVNAECTTGGKTACDILVDLDKLPTEYSKADIKKLVLQTLTTLTGLDNNPKRLQDQSIAAMAVQCAVSYSLEQGDGTVISELRTALGSSNFDEYLKNARLDPAEVAAAGRYADILGMARRGETAAAQTALAQYIKDSNAGTVPARFWYAAKQLEADIAAGRVPTVEEMQKFARAIYATEPVNWGLVQSATGVSGVSGTIDECAGDPRCKAYANMVNAAAKPGSTSFELSKDTAATIALMAAEAIAQTGIGQVVGAGVKFISPTVAMVGGKVYEKIGGIWKPASESAGGQGWSAVFRGTSAGYEGSAGNLVKPFSTPTSTDPWVATVFATKSEAYGVGVVHIATKGDLAGVGTLKGSVFGAIEAEIPLNILPAAFANKASITISAAEARQILAQMGFPVPRVISENMTTALLQGRQPMTTAQITEFMQRARAIANH